MNRSIEHLAETASKSDKTIIGLMSGTSLDGLDIALCKISGSGTATEIELREFETISYDQDTRQWLKSITSIEEVSLELLCLLHSWLGSFHGRLVLETLGKWGIPPSDIDCIASHGQTVYHAPKRQHRKKNMPNATLQIGEGDHLATTTGILTISDFRQKHTAAGGEGAPMVSLVDHMLYRDDREARILLNIGGIANFTYLPAQKTSEQAVVTTDTGPGNTLIDNAVQQYFSRDYDQNGTLARQGTVHRDALKALKADPHFQQPLPKTTGPELFNMDWVNKKLTKAGINKIPPKDLVATLTRLSAETIANSINHAIPGKQETAVYISGGGIHNPVLIEWIEELLPGCEIKSFQTIGFDPDAKEAVLFAVLANEMLSGEGFEIEPGSEQRTNFGKISFPT